MQEENQIRNTEKIFVRLLDEDIDVYRPVNAVKIGDNKYEILDDDIQAYNDDLEEWEFAKGDVVQCVKKPLSQGNEKNKLTLVVIKKIDIKGLSWNRDTSRIS